MNRKYFSSKGLCRIFLHLIILATFLGFSLTVSSAVIDTFSTGQTVLLDTTIDGNSVSGGVGNGSDTTMLGGARDASIEVLSGYPRAKMLFIDSVGYVSTNSYVTSAAKGVFQWDGPDNTIGLNETGLGGVDLTENGVIDTFALTTVYADYGHEFSIAIYTDATHWTEITYFRPSSLSTVTEYYNFANFTDPAQCNTTNSSPGISSIRCGSGPADMSNVGAIQLIRDPLGKTARLDWIIDSFETTSTTGCFGKIGNSVWHDADSDGLQSPEEIGIENVIVNLKDIQGNAIAMVTTDADGLYEFPGLCANDYIVEVDITSLPAEYNFASPTLQGADEALDSNINSTTIILSTDTTIDLTMDFGYYIDNSACTSADPNYMWLDENANGVQDADEGWDCQCECNIP